MSNFKVIATNAKARYEYHIQEKFEAGIALEGSEVKSLRSGKLSLVDSFIYPKDNEIYIHNLYIAPYKHVSTYSPKPLRLRKLLLKKHEINKIIGKVKISGTTVVPLKIFFNDRNLVKLDIAIVSGKKKHDKRQAIKEREWGRAKQAMLKKDLNEN